MHQKMDTHLGTWNVGLNENNRTKIRINSVCDMGGAKSAVRYTVLTGEGNDTHQQRAGFFIYKRILLAVEVAEFNDSDRMSQSARRLLVRYYRCKRTCPI